MLLLSMPRMRVASSPLTRSCRQHGSTRARDGLGRDESACGRDLRRAPKSGVPTHLEAREDDGLSTPPVRIKRPVRRGRRLVDQVQAHRQVHPLRDARRGEHIARPDARLLQDHGRLDAPCGHDDFTAGFGGVSVSLLVSELDAGGSGRRVGREDQLADVGAGEDCRERHSAERGSMARTGQVRLGLVPQVSPVWRQRSPCGRVCA